MAESWPAPKDVVEAMEGIREKFHLPRIEGVRIGVNIEDAKAFVDDRLNLGSVSKVPPKYRDRMEDPIEFLVSLPADTWKEVLKPNQQEALLDLHLTRIDPVLVPETRMEGSKKVVVKDDMGRTKYTDEQKLDKNGSPMWRVLPLGLTVFSRNARRFGLWFADLEDFGQVLKEMQQ